MTICPTYWQKIGVLLLGYGAKIGKSAKTPEVIFTPAPAPIAVFACCQQNHLNHQVGYKGSNDNSAIALFAVWQQYEEVGG